MLRTVVVFAFLAAGAVPAIAAEKSDPRCALYGEGFKYVPNSATCVRISGQIRTDYTVGKKAKGFGSQTRITFETRTDTDFGPVRVLVSPKVEN